MLFTGWGNRPATAPTTSLTYCPVDTAYGCYPTGSGLQFGCLILPTPGAHNVQGALGITKPPKATPFTQTDLSYLPGKPFGDWVRNTNYTKNTWLAARRAYLLGIMQANGLYLP